MCDLSPAARPLGCSRRRLITVEVRGYVLAGGRSRRFGRDKSQVVIDDRRALDRQIDLVSAACSGPVTVIGDHDRLVPSGVEVVSDRYGHQGPLDGVITALHHAGNSPLALVVAVDLWNLTPPTLNLLVEVFLVPESEVQTDVAFLRSDVDEQPLAAVWRVSESRSVMQRAFDAGERSVSRAWGALRRTPVTVAPNVLANINTADEFELWRASRSDSDDIASLDDRS